MNILEKETNKHLYSQYRNMINRCYNKNIPIYQIYGAKGVTVCNEWKNSFETFKNWCIENNWKYGLVLDKDILCEKLNIHPKIYSPETTLLISVTENSKEAALRRHKNEEKERYIQTEKMLKKRCGNSFISFTNGENNKIRTVTIKCENCNNIYIHKRHNQRNPTLCEECAILKRTKTRNKASIIKYKNIFGSLFVNCSFSNRRIYIEFYCKKCNNTTSTRTNHKRSKTKLCKQCTKGN